jgi:hypothetical protein
MTGVRFQAEAGIVLLAITCKPVMKPTQFLTESIPEINRPEREADLSLCRVKYVEYTSTPPYVFMACSIKNPVVTPAT